MVSYEIANQFANTFNLNVSKFGDESIFSLESGDAPETWSTRRTQPVRHLAPQRGSACTVPGPTRKVDTNKVGAQSHLAGVTPGPGLIQIVRNIVGKVHNSSNPPTTHQTLGAEAFSTEKAQETRDFRFRPRGGAGLGGAGKLPSRMKSRKPALILPAYSMTALGASFTNF